MSHLPDASAPLIIGAGPAGTAAAITLARAGYRPIILSAPPVPADKVCGDFLSTDTIQFARSLDVDPAALGAAPIYRVRLIHGERLTEAALPFPAMGLSRRVLDQALLRQAERAGARLQAGQTVRRLTRTRPIAGVSKSLAAMPLHAETVFAATGKHDLRDIPRRHTRPRCRRHENVFRLAPGAGKNSGRGCRADIVSRRLCRHAKRRKGQTVLCVAVRQHAFQAYGASWSSLMAAIEGRNRRFAAMLAGARALLPRPLAVAGVPYGYRAPGVLRDGLYRLGDQAAVIPSLTGDGMAIALHSGRTGAESWLAGESSAEYHVALMPRTLRRRCALPDCCTTPASAVRLQPSRRASRRTVPGPAAPSRRSHPHPSPARCRPIMIPIRTGPTSRIRTGPEPSVRQASLAPTLSPSGIKVRLHPTQACRRKPHAFRQGDYPA